MLFELTAEMFGIRVSALFRDTVYGDIRVF